MSVEVQNKEQWETRCLVAATLGWKVYVEDVSYRKGKPGITSRRELAEPTTVYVSLIDEGPRDRNLTQPIARRVNAFKGKSIYYCEQRLN